ncbi:MAG: diguanylate cyclase [Candidatus Omnitrophota bacterium]
MIQDPLGYILVGTQSGIGIFDGNNFRVITKNNGLPNNEINQFEKDNRGNIWVATGEGLAKIDTADKYKITNYLKTYTIFSLSYDFNNDTLWVITNKGVYSFKRGRISEYLVVKAKYDLDEDYRIKGLTIGNSGTKYFYSNWEIMEVTNDAMTGVVQSSAEINFVKELDHKIIVGTNNGLFIYNNHQLVKYIALPPNNLNVTDIEIDEKGWTWIGTREGLLVYTNINNPSDVITLNDTNGFRSRWILSILIDREKNILVGTEWGLAQLSPYLFKMYDETDGLPHKYVWAYTEYNGSILMACNNGIAQLDPKTGILTPFSSLNRQLKDHSIRVIINTNPDEFLLGTKEYGIYIWSMKTDQLKKINKAHVFSGVKAPDNTIWLGTDNGILQYDGESFKLIRDGLRDNYVWALGLIDKDTILAGTCKGVQLFRNGKYTPSDIENKIDKSTLINDINVISPTEILVATELNGLYIYNNKKIKHLTTTEGLLHNDVWSVIKDGMDNIWINTSVSLDRYTDGFISHFDRRTGLFGEEGSIHSTLKFSNGKIYIGIYPGFIEIPVQESHSHIKNPILHITDIKVNNEFYPVNSSSIRLSYKQKNIDIQYMAVSTRKENPIFYKTRLSPLDKQWSEPTQETHIKYMSLPPDEYTFEVIANNGGKEKEWFKSINKISIIIEKPFWLKWWFFALIIIWICVFVFLFIGMRMKALERQKRILEKLVRKRTEELGQKNKELEHLSITDPLTDLKNRRYLEEKIKEDIGLIERYIYSKTNSPEKEPAGVPNHLGVFILDIDHFKKVNDEYGHKAGDIVIIDIAKMLVEMLRNSDTIVRWGGEEFLIITRQYEYGKEIFFDLAERIRKKVESFEFKIHQNMTIHKTISVGFSYFPFLSNNIREVNWSQVVSLADSALYIAKNNGRNLTVGIDCGERELDIDFKEIVSNIEMGIKEKYLKLICSRENLVISQHKK